MTVKRKRKNKWIDLPELVKFWQKAKTVEDVAKKFGISVRGACNRASYLRKRGVPLKTMYAPGRGRPKMDYSSMVKLAQACMDRFAKVGK